MIFINPKLKNMKRVLFLSVIFVIMPFVNVFADEEYRINHVLKEITSKQTEAYHPMFVSTYTYELNGHQVAKRFFVDTTAPEHNSYVKVIESKSSTQPWLLRINGRSVYVEFRDDNGLQSGDEGVIKYYNGDLYLVID